jgi:hypothetical protein
MKNEDNTVASGINSGFFKRTSNSSRPGQKALAARGVDKLKYDLIL